MSLEHIKHWLQSERSYEVGVSLFEKHAKDPARAAFFRKGESALRRSMLIEAMVKLQADLSAPPTPEAHAEKLVKAITTDAEFDRLPETVRQMISRVKEIYKIGQAKKSKLFLIPDKRDRAILANEIRDGDEESSRLLERIDYARKNGQLPPEQNEDEELNQLSAAELLNRRNQLQQQRSRAKRAGKMEVVAELTNKLEAVYRKIDEDAV